MCDLIACLFGYLHLTCGCVLCSVASFSHGCVLCWSFTLKVGPIYFFTYVISVFFILINVFLAIINDAYADTKEEMEVSEYESEMGAYCTVLSFSRMGLCSLRG
jgi:hypothetical protein